MTDIDNILNKHGAKMVQDIRDNIVSSGENTSGKTAESVRYEVKSFGGKSTLSVIGGRAFFPTVEKGSKPSTKKPSPEMIESLSDWAKKKGIQGRDKKGRFITATSLAWAQAITILRDGSKLYQLGGRRDIYTNVKNEALQPMIDEIRKAEKDYVLKSLINPVKL